MESLQLSQVLADLSNLGAAVCLTTPSYNIDALFLSPTNSLHISLATNFVAFFSDKRSHQQEPEAAAAIVNANIPIIQTQLIKDDAHATSQQQQRPSSGLRRAWSSEAGSQPRFDKMGRRILISSPKSGSAANSIPGTPQPSNVRCATILPRPL
jgi:hypothetical protein